MPMYMHMLAFVGRTYIGFGLESPTDDLASSQSGARTSASLTELPYIWSIQR